MLSGKKQYFLFSSLKLFTPILHIYLYINKIGPFYCSGLIHLFHVDKSFKQHNVPIIQKLNILNLYLLLIICSEQNDTKSQLGVCNITFSQPHSETVQSQSNSSNMTLNFIFIMMEGKLALNTRKKYELQVNLHILVV